MTIAIKGTTHYDVSLWNYSTFKRLFFCCGPCRFLSFGFGGSGGSGGGGSGNFLFDIIRVSENVC